MGGSVGKVIGVGLIVTAVFFPGAAIFATAAGLTGFTAAAIASATGLLGAALLVKASLSGQGGESSAVSGAQESTLRAASTPAKWILGRARTAGLLVRYLENEDGTECYAFVVVGEGECTQIEKVWVQGEEVPIATSASGIHPLDHRTVTLRGTGRYLGRARFDVRLNARGNPGITLPSTAFIPQIGEGNAGLDDYRRSTHTFTDLSWVFCTFNQNNYGDSVTNRFWTSHPINRLEFLIKGLKITWPGQSTPQWTENAAAIRYWFMRERMGIPAEAFDEASVRAAISLCGETVTTPLPAGYSGYSGTAIRYAVNMVINSTDSVSAILHELDFAWQGHAVEVNGVWHFRPGVDRPITQHLRASAMLAPGTAAPTPAIDERVNALTMQLAQSAAHDYQNYDLPLMTDADSLARDGELFQDDLGRMQAVNEPVSAARLLAIFLRRVRHNETYMYHIMLEQGVEWISSIPGDRILVTDPENGLTAAPMRIISHVLNPDWSVQMTLQSAPAGIHDGTTDLPALRPRQISFPQQPVGPDAPTGIKIIGSFVQQTDGTSISSLIVTWDPAPVDRTEIRWRQVIDGNYRLLWGNGDTCLVWGNSTGLEWQAVTFVSADDAQPAVTTTARLNGLTEGDLYEVQVRHVGRYGIAGPWSPAVQRAVSGDNIPPGVPTSPTVESRADDVLVSWTNPTDADFHAVEVWRSIGADGLDLLDLPARAVLVGSTGGTSIPITGGILDGDTREFAIRSLDDSGNPSAAVSAGFAFSPLPISVVLWNGFVRVRSNTISDGTVWQHVDLTGLYTTEEIMAMDRLYLTGSINILSFFSEDLDLPVPVEADVIVPVPITDQVETTFTNSPSNWFAFTINNGNDVFQGRVYIIAPDGLTPTGFGITIADPNGSLNYNTPIHVHGQETTPMLELRQFGARPQGNAWSLG